MLPIITMITELPTLFFALSSSFLPMLMLTNAQQPSPTMTAIASATTVSGNTTVLAALPNEPKYEAFAIKIWSTMLYNAPTSSEIMHGRAYFLISHPMRSVPRFKLDFLSIFLPF